MTPNVAATAPVPSGGGDAPGTQASGGAGFDHSVTTTRQADQSGTSARVNEASLESRGNGVQATGNAAERSVRAGPVGDPIGHQILDRLDALHEQGKSFGRLGGAGTATPNEPELKVAAQLPGPAQASPASANAPASGQPNHDGADAKFGDQLNQIFDRMENSTGYVVQSSMVSNTGQSFTSSVKQLISSN